MTTKPNAILGATTEDVKQIIEHILAIEKEYQHYQNLDSHKDTVKEIELKIMKIIEQAVKDEA